MAPDDRPRHVLDARAPGDLPRRHRRRADVRLARAAHDVRRHARPSAREAVRFWGFRAPFGAWVCIWGAFAMLTSAPFDDWWHNTYGLDVKILSPPHAVLAAGIAAIQFGAMLMALAWQNRAAARSPRLQLLFFYGAGLLLLMIATLSTEYTRRWDMHQSLFYQVSCGRVPVLPGERGARIERALAGDARGRGLHGGHVLMLWILPLFPGRRCSGRSTCSSIASAAGSAAAAHRAGARRSDLADAAVRRAARDWRLRDPRRGVPRRSSRRAVAVRRLPDVPLGAQLDLREPPDGLHGAARGPGSAGIRSIRPTTWARAAIALALAFVSARCGLWWGNWMARVQR